MKTHVITAGAVLGLLVGVHIWRFIEEGSGLLKNPWYVGSAVFAAAFCLWAWRLVRLMPRA
ncbi:MAG: hypothetical protein IPP88_02165 [Betaproteobacteria bacterium]|nr:hypothetical protein [Betaproteobacteria bacterium]